MRSRRPALVLLAALAGIVSVAAAAEEPERKLGVTRKGDDLLVSMGYTDIFDDESMEKLNSGLPTTILMRMSLVAEGSKTPLSFTLRTSQITYDLWDEVYHVTVKSLGAKTKKVLVEDRDEAISLAAKVKKLPVSIEDVPPDAYLLRVQIDRNPLSKEVIKGMNNWLKRPIGASGRLKPGDSFFGSFISFFVNKKIQKAEMTKKFKSQTFKL